MRCGTRIEKAPCEARGFVPVGAIKARFGVGNGVATTAARPSPVNAVLSRAGARSRRSPGGAVLGSTRTAVPGRAVLRLAAETLGALLTGGSPQNADSRARPARHVIPAARYQGEMPLTRTGRGNMAAAPPRCGLAQWEPSWGRSRQ